MTPPDSYLPRRLLHIFFADYKDRKTDVPMPPQKHKKKERKKNDYQVTQLSSEKIKPVSPVR